MTRRAPRLLPQFKKIARDVNEDARNHARSLKGTPEFERSSNARKKSRDAFCTPEGPAWLRAYGPSRSHRRPRRVPPRRYCAEPQDYGAASTPPANRWSVRIDCVSRMAIRLWCSPVRRRRPASSKPKTPSPTAKANYGGHFSTASVKIESGRARAARPFYPQQQTQSVRLLRHVRKSAQKRHSVRFCGLASFARGGATAAEDCCWRLVSFLVA